MTTTFPEVGGGNNIFEDYCLRVLGHLDPRSMFLSIKDYRNNFGEVSDFSIVFHVNYFNTVRKSLEIIKNYVPSAKDCNNKGFAFSDLEMAKSYILYSLKESLKGEFDPSFIHPHYTCGGVYSPVKDCYGDNIKGVILHKRTSALHIYGLKINKIIKQAAKYNKRDSKPETLAKKFLESKTPLQNWRQFKLLPGRFKTLAVQRQVIEG